MLRFLQYQVVDCLARLLAKTPIWTCEARDEDSIGRQFDNRTDFTAERSIQCLLPRNTLLQVPIAMEKIYLMPCVLGSLKNGPSFLPQISTYREQIAAGKAKWPTSNKADLRSVGREVWLGEVTERLLQDSEAWRKVDLYSPSSAEGLQQVCNGQ